MSKEYLKYLRCECCSAMLCTRADIDISKLRCPVCRYDDCWNKNLPTFEDIGATEFKRNMVYPYEVEYGTNDNTTKV